MLVMNPTSVIVTLIDNSEIMIYIYDVEGFMEDLDKLKLNLIDAVEPLEPVPGKLPVDDDELMEVDLIFIDGSSMQCSIGLEDKESIEAYTLIRSCNGTEVLSRLRTMAAVEKDLDTRLMGVYAVINNIPTLIRRSKLHDQYLKRKTAYVVSMEALVDGAFRD